MSERMCFHEGLFRRTRRKRQRHGRSCWGPRFMEKECSYCGATIEVRIR